MARTYKRDSNGRFAGGGGGGSRGGGSGGGGGSRGGGPGKGGNGSKKPNYKPRGKGQTAQSTISEADAMARLSAGRKLRGKGSSPLTRAERNLERGLSSGGKRARRSVATAKRAIDYMAATGTGRKGKGKGKAAAAAVAATTSKRGRPTGASGRKVGTQSQQRRAAKDQAARSKAFSSKSTAGRSAKAAYKAATSNLRFERAARAAGGGTRGTVTRAQSVVTAMRRTRSTRKR